MHALLDESGAQVVVCDVGALAGPDVVAIDGLARLQLTARRLGSQIRLRRASGPLQGLLALTGLAEVVPGSGLCVESCRQPEEWEQAGGVEEEADPPDAQTEIQIAGSASQGPVVYRHLGHWRPPSLLRIGIG
jgi:hypothetical protein